jgi:hypothetical protein
MRIVDMSPEQLKKYVEDNYSIHSLLKIISHRDLLDVINNNEDIYEDHDHE